MSDGSIHFKTDSGITRPRVVIDIPVLLSIIEKYGSALQVISEMPCVPDNCASCYAKKVLEGGE